MSLFEHFFKVCSLYLEARTQIRIRFRIKVLRIRNTGSPTLYGNIFRLDLF